MSFAMMNVQELDGKWWVTQPGWKNYGPFDTERAAERWANENIDDQVFGKPNTFVPELRTPE